VSACVLSLLRRRKTDGISFLPATHNSAREKASSAPEVGALHKRAPEFSLRVGGGGERTFSRSREKRVIKRISPTS
jgi:hypothetical protein